MKKYKLNELLTKFNKKELINTIVTSYDINKTFIIDKNYERFEIFKIDNEYRKFIIVFSITDGRKIFFDVDFSVDMILISKLSFVCLSEKLKMKIFKTIYDIKTKDHMKKMPPDHKCISFKEIMKNTFLYINVDCDNNDSFLCPSNIDDIDDIE